MDAIGHWIELKATAIQAVAATIGVAVALGAALLVLRGLRHHRAGNFTAYNTIRQMLQDDPRVVAGRTLLRKFGDQPTDNWLQSFEEMSGSYMRSSWYEELDRQFKNMSDNEKVEHLNGLMAEGYRAFDLVGILALNSQIPGLVEIVVIEWMDSIIALWENGRRFFKDRVSEGRTELFQCFSVLYVLAKREKRRSGSKFALYPATGMQFFSWRLSRIRAAFEAKRVRIRLSRCHCGHY